MFIKFAFVIGKKIYKMLPFLKISESVLGSLSIFDIHPSKFCLNYKPRPMCGGARLVKVSFYLERAPFSQGAIWALQKAFELVNLGVIEKSLPRVFSRIATPFPRTWDFGRGQKCVKWAIMARLLHIWFEATFTLKKCSSIPLDRFICVF